MRTLLALALTCCFTSFTQAEGTMRHELSVKELSELQLKVANQMVDPFSADFRNIHAIKYDDGVIAVCGEVNGKNDKGEVVGYTIFFGHLHDPSRPKILIGHTERLASIGASYCSLISNAP